MRFTTATLLQVALCASSINALALPLADVMTIEERAAAGDDAPSEEVQAIEERADLPPSASVSLTGQKLNGKFIAKPEPVDEPGKSLQKRNPAAVVLLTPIFNVVAGVTAAAIQAAVVGLVSMAFWNPVRENFTKNTVKRMWDNNPNPGLYAAAVCYNKGYRIQRPNGINGKVSAKLRLGAFFTDYDCMYMEGNNQFYTDSEGGYINLAYHYDSNRCTFIQDNGDLHC